MRRNLVTALLLVLVGALSGQTDQQFSVSDSSDVSLNALYQFKQMQLRIDQCERMCRECQGKPGQPGPKGDTGANGKDGEPGKDGVVDYEKVWAWIKDHPPEQPEVDVTKLPPITFERLGGDGSVLDSITVPLGGKARFPAMTVHYQNESGSVLDTDYVPIGGTLNLHIDVLKK